MRIGVIKQMILGIHSMDQALAIIDLENAINLLLPEISPCISKTRFAKVCKYKEECLYIEALEYITAYIEPFVDHLDTSTLALLLESWTFACKYRRLCVEKEERRYEKYCTDGQETYFAKAVIEALEFKGRASNYAKRERRRRQFTWNDVCTSGRASQ